MNTFPLDILVDLGGPTVDAVDPQNDFEAIRGLGGRYEVAAGNPVQVEVPGTDEEAERAAMAELSPKELAALLGLADSPRILLMMPCSCICSVFIQVSFNIFCRQSLALVFVMAA